MISVNAVTFDHLRSSANWLMASAIVTGILTVLVLFVILYSLYGTSVTQHKTIVNIFVLINSTRLVQRLIFMDILELQERLQNFIGKKISQTELGVAMGGLKRQTINTRIKNCSEVTVTELLNTQEYFKRKIILFYDENDVQISSNTFKQINNEQVLINYEFFGHRLAHLQDELGYLDKAMARLMDMDEKRYMRVKLGKEAATALELARLASRVDVSLDWLIQG